MRWFLGCALAALSLTACTASVPVPGGFEAVVEDARASLLSQDDDLFATFDFLGIRCRADGGRIVEFERRSLFGPTVFAFAAQGPNAVSWGGGWGLTVLDGDPEIEHFFSVSPEASC